MWDPDNRCCPGDFGGSHYHCAYCGCVSGMMGHAGNKSLEQHCPPPDQRPEYAAHFVWKKVDQ